MLVAGVCLLVAACWLFFVVCVVVCVLFAVDCGVCVLRVVGCPLRVVWWWWLFAARCLLVGVCWVVLVVSCALYCLVSVVCWLVVGSLCVVFWSVYCLLVDVCVRVDCCVLHGVSWLVCVVCWKLRVGGCPFYQVCSVRVLFAA